MLLGIISGGFIRPFINSYHFVLLSTSVLLCGAALFVFDAIFISNTNKNILIVMIACVVSYTTIYGYFDLPDVYWDPFNNGHTRMSVKSINISAYTNLVLFMLKPIVTQIARFCRQIIIKCT